MKLSPYQSTNNLSNFESCEDLKCGILHLKWRINDSQHGCKMWSFLLCKCHMFWLPGLSGEPSLPRRFLFIHSKFVPAVLWRLHFFPKQINLIFSLSIFKLKDNLWDSRRFVGTVPVFSIIHVLLKERIGMDIFWSMLQIWDEGTWYWDAQFLKLSFPYLCWLKIRDQAQV